MFTSPVARAAIILAFAEIAPLGLPAQQPAADHPTSWDAAFGVRVGTTGYGVEVAKLLTGHFGARVGGNFGSYSTTQTESDIRFHASVKANSASFLLDFFPGSRGSFHLTGGLHTRPLKASGTGVPTSQGTFTINDRDYTASQVGTLGARLKLAGAAPYAGLGFGTPANRGSSVKLRLDLGVILARPEVVLTATGAASNAQLRADLAAQQAELQHDIDKWAKAYPVIALGLAYKR